MGGELLEKTAEVLLDDKESQDEHILHIAAEQLVCCVGSQGIRHFGAARCLEGDITVVGKQFTHQPFKLLTIEGGEGLGHGQGRCGGPDRPAL